MELPPKLEPEKPKKLTREGVMKRLEAGEDFEKLNLRDLDLAGLDFENKSFKGADLRGVTFYRQEDEIEVKTNLKGADFTNAAIADMGPEVFFGRVEAQGAKFGFTESLIDRRIRQQKSGNAPDAKDIGGYHNFNGSEGDFKQTTWLNIDFGGNTGYEAIFDGADLSGAVFEGCDLSEIDFSQANIEGIKIIDPLSLNGLKITEKQIETLIQAIILKGERVETEFLQEKKAKGPEQAIEEFLEEFRIDTIYKLYSL